METLKIIFIIILVLLLIRLITRKLIEFPAWRGKLLAKTYSYRLWEPAYALNGGCSDDGFEYFRTWLIGQGKNKFYWSVKYPRLLFFIALKELMQDYEGLAYCANEAYELKTGKDFTPHDDIRYDDPGKIFKEGEAFARYPELALLPW